MSRWPPLVTAPLPHFRTRKRRRRLEALRARFGGRCFYCRVALTLKGEPNSSIKTRVTHDHLIPRRKGGTSAKDNIVAACFTCNVNKADGSWLDFYVATRLRLAQQPTPSEPMAQPIIRPGKESPEPYVPSGHCSQTHKAQTG